MVEKLISEIKNDWFYSEPLLFSVACTHVAVENNALSVPMRSGRMRLEYSPLLLSKMIQEYLYHHHLIYISFYF